MSAGYLVNLPSLTEHFPPAFSVPEVLKKLAEWLEEQPWGSLGYFSITGSRLGDFEVTNGADLTEQFALFLRTSDGSMLGYWLHEGSDHKSPPVVCFGSDGDLETRGVPLREMLLAWGENRHIFGDLNRWQEDDKPDHRPQLLKWVQKNLNHPVSESSTTGPMFAEWFHAWRIRQETWCDQDPGRQELAERLRQIVPFDADGSRYSRSHFSIILVGSKFQVFHNQFGDKPITPSIVVPLERLFRVERERRAQQFPHRGLWFSAHAMVMSKGPAYLSCEFYREPKCGDSPVMIPKKDYLADLAAYPRSDYWMPAWLRKKIA